MAAAGRSSLGFGCSFNQVAAWPRKFDTGQYSTCLEYMEVQLTPELEEKIANLSTQTGCPADELVQDVMPGYVYELAGVRDTLDTRYDGIKSGRVKLIHRPGVWPSSESGSFAGNTFHSGTLRPIQTCHNDRLHPDSAP